jgi:hypothetical protein
LVENARSCPPKAPGGVSTPARPPPSPCVCAPPGPAAAHAMSQTPRESRKGQQRHRKDEDESCTREIGGNAELTPELCAISEVSPLWEPSGGNEIRSSAIPGARLGALRGGHFDDPAPLTGLVRVTAVGEAMRQGRAVRRKDVGAALLEVELTKLHRQARRRSRQETRRCDGRSPRCRRDQRHGGQEGRDRTTSLMRIRSGSAPRRQGGRGQAVRGCGFRGESAERDRPQSRNASKRRLGLALIRSGGARLRIHFDFRTILARLECPGGADRR